VTARLCDLATLLIGVIRRLWRRRSAGFHVRDRSLLTFCRSVTGCCPRVGTPRRRIPKLGLSTKYFSCKTSARCVSLDSAESVWSAPMAKMPQVACKFRWDTKSGFALMLRCRTTQSTFVWRPHLLHRVRGRGRRWARWSYEGNSNGASTGWATQVIRATKPELTGVCGL
jgi:hypothetical protein